MMRVLGLAVFVLSIPFFLAWVKAPLRYRRWAWFAIGLLPFTIRAWHLDVSIISWALWPGYVKGALVSLLDSLALAIVVTMRDPVRGRPLLWPYLAFLAGTAVSVAFATPAMASAFFTWQTARTILVFVAVSKVAARPEGPRWIVGGLAAGMVFQAVYAINERLGGAAQAAGTMDHRNMLGMSIHFALLMSIAAILAGDRRTLVKLGAVGGIVAAAVTGSRAAAGLTVVAVAALVLLSLARRSSALKVRVAVLGGVTLLVATPIALSTVGKRSAAELQGSDDEREALKRAARAMWSDHPMGVGANQYVPVANTRGYSQRAGVVWNYASRNTNVHNTYLLLGAETGWLGLATFLVLLASGLVMGARAAWARPRLPQGEYALGATVVLAVVAVHCFYEWIFVTWTIQYLFAIALGIIAGIAKQNRVAAIARRSAARAAMREVDDPVPVAQPGRRPVPALRRA